MEGVWRGNGILEGGRRRFSGVEICLFLRRFPPSKWPSSCPSDLSLTFQAPRGAFAKSRRCGWVRLRSAGKSDHFMLSTIGRQDAAADGRACCRRVSVVGRVSPSAPRWPETVLSVRVWATVDGALGETRPTFTWVDHLGNTPSNRRTLAASRGVNSAQPRGKAVGWQRAA